MYEGLFGSGLRPAEIASRALILQAVQVDQHCADAEPLELFRRRDVGTGVVEHHEIRLARGHGFDVRRQPFADARHRERGRRVVAPLRAADEPIARADGEQDFGERWEERNDAACRCCLVPTCRRVTCTNEEYRNGDASKHHPSREGTDWWRE